MVYCIETETCLCVWWDPRSEYKKGYKYKVTVDGKQVVYTPHVCYDFQPLKGGTTHNFEIQLVDENKNVVGKTEYATYTTRPHREKVDLSLPPYSVIGDGVTDNTAILQKAINECKPDQYLFLPYGIYIADKLTINGNVKIQFGAGAVICDKETAKRL